MAKRLLIVGMGSIGLRHARLYREQLEVEVCEARPEGLEEVARQLPGLRLWNDYEAALASKPDYVLVATPHHLHADMTCAALARDIPVLSEKPMSHDLAGAERMAALSEERGVPLAVGYHLRFHPGVRWLIESRANLAAPLFARYCVDSLITLQNSRSRYQATLFGALLMDYAHGFDLMAFVTGQSPTRIVSHGTAGEICGLRADPFLISGILTYDAGFQAEVHLSYTGQPEIHTLELLDPDARRQIALNSGRIARHELSETGIPHDEALTYERDQMYLDQWTAFEAHCAGKASRVCTAAEGVATNRTVENFLASLRAAT